MSDLVNRIADLSPEKRALLLRRLNRGQAQPESSTIGQRKIRPQPRDRNSFPLSFAQQRLWFLEQLEAQSTTFNLPDVMRLRGRLDVTALESSLSAIVARHEILRTTFAQPEGAAEPVQLIHPPQPVPLPISDLRAVPDAERAEAVIASATEEIRQPFDLQAGPLFRARLLLLGPEEHVLVLTMHHSISDGWSMGIFWRELAAAYSVTIRGQSTALPPLPIQYADYAVWQRESLTAGMAGGLLERQLAYWRQQLADAPSVLELPTDYPRPAVRSSRGAIHTFEIPAALAARLQALGRQEGATLFMVLLAGFKVLLQRYSGQYDIVVGTPIAGRDIEQTEELIGCFVNTLALRTRLDGDPSVRALLAQVRDLCLGAYAHQELPFEKLVEELQPERDQSRSPIFQVLFALHNAPIRVTEFADLSRSPITVELGSAQYDLTLALMETEQGLSGLVQYSSDLFAPATIERLVGHYQTLLAGIVAQPEQSIARLPLLPEAERTLLLDTWNATAAPYPRDLCVHDLIAAQAARTPDVIAVVCGDARLSYRELNGHANQLAHHLRAMGVRPESRVALCLDRSPELLIAMLAVLKAGGCYVPLDPEYPEERLQFMLRDSQAQAILTQVPLLKRLPTLELPAVCLDRDWPVIAAQPQTDPAPLATPEHLAYMIYTSGSTGQPKGAMIVHRSVVNNLWWRQTTVPLDGEDRLLQTYSFSFDPSVWACFWPLMAGAQVVIVRSSEQYDSAALVRLMARHGITVYGGAPALHSALLAEPEFRACTRLRYIVSGGDRLSGELQRRVFAQLQADLVNAYGPTETTIDATTWRCPRVAEPESAPIGRPIPNVQVYLLDRFFQPVPIGVPGELYIGGDNLGRGYHQRPDLTAERFLPNPFSHPEGARPGSRLYRSGDLARFRHDGTIEFLGRVDEQVKLRGYRIELGEIESVLRQHPAVHEAVVVIREGAAGQQLVAYVVEEQGNRVPPGYPLGDGGDADCAAELRALLESRLPGYMVPAAFVFLSALPLSPNGKLDLRQLPAPELSAAPAFVPPRTPLEAALAQIWAEVLHLERVGVQDNFFALGGHSLLATQIASRIRERLQATMPLQLLFTAPSVAQLAEHLLELAPELAAGQGKTERSAIQPMLRRAATTPIPLSFAQQRLWFLDQFTPNSAMFNIPGAMRLRGRLDVTALEASLTAIVARHEILRTSFAQVEDAVEPVQLIHPPQPVALPVSDLRPVPAPARAAALQAAAAEEIRQPFDLRAGPLFRARLLLLEPDEYVLLLTLHHTITDGWSMSIFWQELAAAYSAQVTGRALDLPALPIQYADYALWQRQWLQGDVLDAQLAFWRQQLADAPALLELPTDFPRPPIQSGRGAAQPFTLSAALTRALRELGQQEGATLFMVLLAAFNVLLQRYSGQHDIVVGTPIAGRTRAETEGLLGCFLNMLPLRTRLDDQPSARALLARVRDLCLGAYAHQELPFEKLVEELHSERALSHSPIFQALFALQNTPAAAPELPGLELSSLLIDLDTAQYDLSMTLLETPQGLSGLVEYNSDLFAPTTIERLVGHYQTLLASIVVQPEQSIARLPLLPEAERTLLLDTWNATAAPFRLDRCVHELFAAQAAHTPDAIALICEDARLSYAELDRSANQLAHHLRTLGVGPEVCVALCLDRSPLLVVALLAVLKAGGGYLPLDPAYPAERLQFMLHDSHAAVILTQEQFTAIVTESSAQPVLLDRDWPAIARQPDHSPEVAVPGDALAYLIYTSGSTGRPKGVQVTHRALNNFLQSMRQRPGLDERDTLLAVTTISFDIAALELFLPLIAGARVVLVDREIAADGSALAIQLTRYGVTTMQATPATWRLLMEAGWQGNPHLKLLCGGEALPPSLVEQLLPRAAALWNMYGPTETTVWSAVERISAANGPIAIGRPIANTQIYILDDHLNPAPIGVPGKLYIGGDGLARGYLHQPALTAERFIPNPFGAIAGTRLYWTGDLARYLPDGRIEYLRRVDHQVKIRGFRIELGEIEALLAAHPAVRSCVVVAREDASGFQRLVAYLSVTADTAPSHAELRSFLQSRLPDYMVPAAFVILETFPLTASGKIDRKALPAPDRSSVAEGREFAAPRTSVERVLAGIWQELLGVPRVGIHDHFFDLGGHSLLATQLIARIRKIFRVELPLHTLFAAPTFAEIAQNLLQLEGAAGRFEKIAQVLSNIENLSDDEKRAILERKKPRTS
jgi:amino acid adenylation domain-containing protein